MVVGEVYLIGEGEGNWVEDYRAYFKLRYFIDGIMVKETPTIEETMTENSDMISFPSALISVPAKPTPTEVKVQVRKWGGGFANPQVRLYEKINCRIDIESEALS